MKRLNLYILLAVFLLFLSSIVYLVQIIIFHKPGETFFYMMQDIAFVPIQVLIVSLIIERVLNEREKSVLLKKLNMLIGAFYSEVGADLIRHCSGFSTDLTEMTPHLLITKEWTVRD